MKKIIILLVSIMFMAGQGFAQEVLKIGEIKDGKLEITNMKGLQAFFMNCLAQSGKLGKDLKIEPSPTGDRFIVSTTVTGNKEKVNSISVMLVNRNNEAVIVSGEGGDSPGAGVGGSVQYTCIGAICDFCYPSIEWGSQWFPLVRCTCADPNGKCNMSMSFTINVSAGF
jgi:hypothetical protein